MGLQSAACRSHMTRQVVLCNPRSHLNCVYTIKITQTFRRLCEALTVNSQPIVRPLLPAASQYNA